MLKKISIDNFILIESQEISLKEGLNVLTGETGHGKSILLKAVSLLFQGNISKKYIRDINKSSYVKGTIDCTNIKIPKDLIKKYNIISEIIIEREFSNKKSSILINKTEATLAELEYLGEVLCQSLTQFQKFELLKPDSQLKFIDNLLLDKSNKNKYDELFNDFLNIKNEQRKLEREFNQIDSVIEYKKEELERLQTLELTDSDLDLQEKIQRIENFEIEKEKITSLLNLFNNEEVGVSNSFNNFKKFINKSEFSEKTLESMTNIQKELNFIENTIIEELDTLDSFQDSLDELISRYNFLKHFLKRHDNSILKLMNHFKELSSTIEMHDSLKIQIIEHEKKAIKLEKELLVIAENLSKERKVVSKVIESKVVREFKELNLEESELRIDFQLSTLSKDGTDEISFLIKTNKGGEFYPLEEIISGGELSRIMFSLINIQKNKGQILSFDEIDAGIGGKTSIQLSKKLLEISKQNQIICITHSPSIAVIANNHIFISKENKNNSTITTIDSLNDSLIKNEIARMLGYEQTTDGIELTNLVIKKLIEQVKG